MMPEPFTIVGPLGSERVVPSPGYSGSPLGQTCQTATWGGNLDIFIDQGFGPLSGIAYANVLMDWDQDGSWSGSSSCTTSAPEHVLVNFPVPAGYRGSLSDLGPPAFTIGPNPGYVWARFSLTEVMVGPNWNGSGNYEGGETEDYLLRVDPTPVLWDVGDRIGSDGIALDDIALTSVDGMLTLAIDSGTTVLTEDETPLESLEAVEVFKGDWPEPPEGKAILTAFNFGPDGATFSPDVSITIEYDPEQLPEGVAEEDLVIASYNSTTGEWEYFPVSVNVENNTVTAEVSHFTVFTILYAAPTPEEAPFNVWVIIGPVLGVLLAGGAVYYFVRRRRVTSA